MKEVGPSVAVHTSVPFSLAHLDEDTESVCNDIVLPRVQQLIQELPQGARMKTHKWRYSQVCNWSVANYLLWSASASASASLPHGSLSLHPSILLSTQYSSTKFIYRVYFNRYSRHMKAVQECWYWKRTHCSSVQEMDLLCQNLITACSLQSVRQTKSSKHYTINLS